jgi:putative peptidoglycan lipid II flippase
MISYFLVGGAASITFVTILTRYRETGREAEGERSLSVILSTMYLVLGGAIVLAEICAPWYVHKFFNGFDAEKAALCIKLTRILLPAQLFFFAGGVFGAVLLVRKQFNVQAVAPLIYNLGTIVGGLLLVKQIGVSSLAIGTVAGAFFGPFLLNAVFARRAGTRFRPVLDWHDEGLREWVRLSLPLMAGISLVTADNWIIAHFASQIGGAVSLFNYAKLGFTAPMAMLAQAAGVASMPFFASLWAKERRLEFATQVADSVSRVACMGLLVASAMVALGKPTIDLVFTGGRFSAAEASLCFSFFAVGISLVGAGHLFTSFFCGGEHFYSNGRRDRSHGVIAAHICGVISLVRSHRTGVRVGYRDRDADPDDCGLAASEAHGFAGRPRLPRDGAVPGGRSGERGGCLGRIFFVWRDAPAGICRAQPLAGTG